jgi:hypothetical protein
VTDERQRAAGGRPALTTVMTRYPVPVLGALVVVLTLSWIIATPRSAGPDEPGHQVRGGALVRGQLDGEPFRDFGFKRSFELPGHVGFPDPVCFAFNEFASASCANDLQPPAGTVPLGTRAADYPVWGHLLAGLGTFAPGSMSGWTSRMTDAVVPLALVIAALWVAARRGALGVGSTLLALTPMAWFMFAVVNPSGLVIAGGVGLWVALTAQVEAGRDRVVGLLAACSWAAMVLPRRDGMVWSSLIVTLVVLFGLLGVRDTLRRLGRSGVVIVALSTLATLVWAGTSDTNAALALFVAPLAPVAAYFSRRGWDRIPPEQRLHRGLYVASHAAVVIGGGVAVMTRRDDGFDRRALELVIGQTGNDLTEAIGNLGWLDTPLPVTATFAWLGALGMLAGVSIVVGRWRPIGVAAAVLGAAVFTSWTLTMLQNDESGEYWQGRYYLPLLVGIPIVLATVRAAPEAGHRIGMAAAVVGLGVANAALFAMVRRYGVGRAGSLLPWDWGTYEAPLPPVVALFVHVAASIALLWWIALRVDRSDEAVDSVLADDR